MDTRRLLGLLGLAQRAGRLAVGISAVESMVRRGPRPLVVIARGAGESQLRKVRKLQPVLAVLENEVDREELARCLGRRELSVVAVNDSGFVKGLRKLRDESEPADRAAARDESPADDGRKRRE